jgi:hypothetical protein
VRTGGALSTSRTLERAAGLILPLCTTSAWPPLSHATGQMGEHWERRGLFRLPFARWLEPDAYAERFPGVVGVVGAEATPGAGADGGRTPADGRARADPGWLQRVIATEVNATAERALRHAPLGWDARTPINAPVRRATLRRASFSGVPKPMRLSDAALGAPAAAPPPASRDRPPRLSASSMASRPQLLRVDRA